MPPTLSKNQLHMADTINFQPHQKISAKDIANLLIVSEASAKRYMADIKKQYDITVITYKHYAKYFHLD
jgi:response regulator of citrate/malate metabolism